MWLKFKYKDINDYIINADNIKDIRIEKYLDKYHLVAYFIDGDSLYLSEKGDYETVSYILINLLRKISNVDTCLDIITIEDIKQGE